MGKAGRFVCIFTPMALTLASLACLAIVMLGNTNKSSSFLSDLYFLKADTSNFTANPNIDVLPGTKIDDQLLASIQKVATEHKLQDFYTVGLWNYCEGDKTTNGTSTAKTGTTSSYNPSTEKITFCSARKSSYWFNPVEVWGLNDTALEQYVPKALNDGLKVYSKVVKFMFVVYVVAICTTAAEVLVGIFAIFSRWGSCVTTIVSGASTLFTFAASLTATIVYSTFMGTFNTALKPYHIHASLGSRMLTVTWLATAFSLGAGLFWTFSVCCCSGRSNEIRYGHKNRGGVTAEKGTYSYERVGSPYVGHAGDRSSQVPLRDMGAPFAGHGQQQREGAYEPFRHQNQHV